MMSVTVPDVMFDAAPELELEPVPVVPRRPAPNNPLNADDADDAEDDCWRCRNAPSQIPPSIKSSAESVVTNHDARKAFGEACSVHSSLSSPNNSSPNNTSNPSPPEPPGPLTSIS